MNSLASLRAKQIQSIQPFEAKEVRSGVYQIACYVSTMSLFLLIRIDNNFPQSKPEIQVQPKVEHEWVDNGFIFHQRLDKWSPQSSLGKLIEEIMLEFSLRPPIMIHSSASTPDIVKSKIQPVVVSDIRIPSLDAKSSIEIEAILEDPVLYQEYFQVIEEVQSIRQVQEQLLIQNASIAQGNLLQAEEIRRLKGVVTTLQDGNLEYRKKLDLLLREQQQEAVRFNNTSVVEYLKKLVQKADDQTELCTASFTEGKLSEEEFIKSFKDIRKTYHIRNAKLNALTS